MFSVVDGIGELADPVAENHHTGALGELEVELDVTVAVDEEVYFGVTRTYSLV